jgi:hypothetical protein
VLKARTPAGHSKKPNSAATQEDGFKDVRSRKGHSTNETAPTSKKAACTAVDTTPKEVATRKFFASLRASDMDTDSTNTEATPRKATAPATPCRPPAIVLTYAVNLIHLQKKLKGVVIENFEFRSTINGTRVITRSKADFQSVKSYFDDHNLSYYSFFPKSEKPIKAVILHLPHNIPAEDISDRLVSPGFNIVGVKQMTATFLSPYEESKNHRPAPVPRNSAEDSKVFHLSSLCYFAKMVQAYKVQNALTQCHN